MTLDKDRRDRAEEAMTLLEEDGWCISDFDVNASGESGVKLSLEVYTYDR